MNIYQPDKGKTLIKKSLNFFRRYIEIQIIDDEEYEKNKNFFIELVEPEIQRGGNIGKKKKIKRTKSLIRVNNWISKHI